MEITIIILATFLILSYALSISRPIDCSLRIRTNVFINTNSLIKKKEKKRIYQPILVSKKFTSTFSVMADFLYDKCLIEGEEACILNVIKFKTDKISGLFHFKILDIDFSQIQATGKIYIVLKPSLFKGRIYPKEVKGNNEYVNGCLKQFTMVPLYKVPLSKTPMKDNLCRNPEFFEGRICNFNISYDTNVKPE
ncbi:hypothetical protein D1816_23805 [Aquimarina sp. AD10]|uniref:hypothetical protein n=1 Tax=Aquimarina sp. AD10 TaxID=1714849 RepID=UPI000E497A00|nr:hypothetical protein [Aquimarina sp. AD10]AXT63243.1 hypothetical protein D1816_23805 [Aquimarina sp. AD10]RKN00744.1 hypothetical protein D7033_07890 [Aquimarina sp. AD10]